jgi:CRISPR-associated protein Cas2
MRTIICFDISQDPRRYRAVKTLLDHTTRVQKSVFEAPSLEQATFLRLRSELEGIVDPDSDNLRYYRLCRACAGRIDHFGVPPGILGDRPDFFVI